MTIRKAVKDLRKACKDTQYEFAIRMHVGQATIGHYERGTLAMGPTAAAKFMRLAIVTHRYDLAEVFRPIVADALGGIVWPVRDEAEMRKVRAMQAILDGQHFIHLRKPLEELLRPVEVFLEEASGNGA